MKIPRHQNTTDRYAWDYRSVAPTVGHMSYERLAYDEQDTTGRMHEDCLVCASHMRMPHQALVPELADLTGSRDSSLPKPRKEIEVSEAAAHLASRMHLQFD